MPAMRARWAAVPSCERPLGGPPEGPAKWRTAYVATHHTEAIPRLCAGLARLLTRELGIPVGTQGSEGPTRT